MKFHMKSIWFTDMIPLKTGSRCISTFIRLNKVGSRHEEPFNNISCFSGTSIIKETECPFSKLCLKYENAQIIYIKAKCNVVEFVISTSMSLIRRYPTLRTGYFSSMISPACVQFRKLRRIASTIWRRARSPSFLGVGHNFGARSGGFCFVRIRLLWGSVQTGLCGGTPRDASSMGYWILPPVKVVPSIWWVGLT